MGTRWRSRPIQRHVTLPSRATPAGHLVLKRRFSVLAPKQLNAVIPLLLEVKAPTTLWLWLWRVVENYQLVQTGCVAPPDSSARLIVMDFMSDRDAQKVSSASCTRSSGKVAALWGSLFFGSRKPVFSTAEWLVTPCVCWAQRQLLQHLWSKIIITPDIQSPAFLIPNARMIRIVVVKACKVKYKVWRLDVKNNKK